MTITRQPPRRIHSQTFTLTSTSPPRSQARRAPGHPRIAVQLHLHDGRLPNGNPHPHGSEPGLTWTTGATGPPPCRNAKNQAPTPDNHRTNSGGTATQSFTLTVS